jgi:hypothetical protein
VVNGVSNARTLTPISAADLLAAYDQPNNTTSFLEYATYTSRAWGGAAPLDTTQIKNNDWAICRLAQKAIHKVSRADVGASYLHQIFSTSNWINGPPMPADPGVSGSGVVLLTNGARLAAFAIGADVAHSIRMSVFDGATWSAWQSIVSTPAARSYLSGSGCEDGDHPTLLWTEGTDVVAMPVAF